MPTYIKIRVEGVKVPTFIVTELGAARLKNGDTLWAQTDFGSTLASHYKPYLVLGEISEMQRGLKNGAWEMVTERTCADAQGFDDVKADRSMTGRQSKRKRASSSPEAEV